MAAENENYLFAKMKETVLSYSIDGFTRENLKPGDPKYDNIEKEVSKHVRGIVNGLKTSHKKFEDPDFGPTDKDPLGALSLYGNAPPAPAGTSKYPAPDTLKWKRPQYSDDQVDEEEEEEEEEEEDEFAFGGGGGDGGGDEVWCMHGELFIDGSSSGDVIQGNLGDCWYLGALSVLGTEENLLTRCFWKTNEFKEFGLFVCVFYKDCALRFVIIDDRIPVFANSGKVAFAHCKDPNELWVLLIEKAYAKLHGCYKALIGGYVHLGLGDLTGFSPRLIGLKPGYMGYSDPIDDEQLWQMLMRYRKWGSLMGTSIQSAPGQGAKVEANAGQGLIMGHAYSLLAAGELDTKCPEDGGKVKLVKLRNPWGKGEWTGSWSDNSPEYEKYMDILNENEATFGEKTDGMNDGTFFMKYEDYRKAYTNIFVAVNFPPDWQGHIVKGSWDGESGGPRDMTTWMSNSKIKFRLPSSSGKPRESKRRPIFINLYINDTRLTLGKEYYKDPLYKVGVGFDVVREDEFNLKFKERMDPDKSVRMKYGWIFEEEGTSGVPDVKVKQPPYMFGTTQLEAMVETDKDYYIVPSIRNRKLAGVYYYQIFSDGEIILEKSGKETALAVEKDVKEMTVGNKKIHLTKAQFYEKTEAVREKLVGEMQRLKKTVADVSRIFYEQNDKGGQNKADQGTQGSGKGIPRTEFKRRLMELGFSLADFPDEDFIVLDENNDGGIDGAEFTAFLQDGLDLNEPGNNPTPVEEPVDDLVFQPTDLEGELRVKVSHANSLRKASSWFAPEMKVGGSSTAADDKENSARLPTISEEPDKDSKSTNSQSTSAGPTKRPKFTYDPNVANAFKAKPISVLDRFPKLPKSLQQTKHSKGNTENIAGDDQGESKLNQINPIEYDVDDPKLKDPETPFVKPAKLDPHKETQVAKRVGSEDKAGLEAAKEIHVDATLYPMEVERTKFLARQKSKMKDGMESVAQQETGLLITRNFATGKKSQLAKMRDMDDEMREFLALDSYFDRQDMKLGAMDDQQSKGLAHSQSAVKFLMGRNYNTGYRYDIWDVIIDRVAIMSVCRSEESRVLSEKLAFDGSSFSKTVLDLSDERIDSIVKSLTPSSETVVGSRVPTPISQHSLPPKSVKSSRGTPAISKNLRSEKGTVSVTALQKSEKKLRASMVEASEKLQKKQDEMEKTHYIEVFRRVEAIPLMKNKYLDEGLCAKVIGNTSFTFGSSIQSWFEFFDKNGDGEISQSEFRSTMKELNTNLSDDAMSMLYMRFQSYGKLGLVDWKAFINFYEGGIMKEATDLEAAKDKNHLLLYLMSIIEKLLQSKENLTLSTSKQRLPDVPESFATSKANDNGSDESKEVDEPPKSKEYRVEMTSLHESQIRHNIHVLKELDIEIDYVNMYRISRIFNFDLAKFKIFLKACDNITVSDFKTNAVLETAEDVTEGIIEAMKQRCAVDKMGFDFTSHEELSKLWFAMAPTLDANMDYESLTRYFYDLFSGGCEKNGRLGEEKKENGTSNDSKVAVDLSNGSSQNKSPWGKHSAMVRNFHVIVFCNIITEEIMFSRWNRHVRENSKDIVNVISYSAFKAFIQQANVDLIEQKLQYLVHLQECSDGGLVNYLVHGYIPMGKKDHLIFILYDPLSSSMFKLRVDGDASAFPIEKNLYDFLKARYPAVPNFKKLMGSILSKNYNSVETPVENRAFTELCSRFRLVNNGTHTTLTVAEDSKFVAKLKELFEKSNVPFFVIVNEISILFEVSNKNAEEAGSMQKLVFGSIRKNKALCNFLVNVMSDLRVVLSTYDGEKMEHMEWVEMLAYLSGLRNPFVTVQLLPTYVEPMIGMIQHYPEELRKKYLSTLAETTKTCAPEIRDQVRFILQECEEPDENEEKEVDEIFLPRIYTGPPDVDGGRHPSWDISFKMKFKPPSLTNCPVRYMDICELYVEHEKKYMIIMVRESKDQSLFMTAYDPRSSTEYMLFGGPPSWAIPGISTEDVYNKVYPPSKDNVMSKQDAIQNQLDETIEMHTNNRINDPHKKLRLGFAITPRLVISVYNRSLSKKEELLGSCQISISPVLSGSGANCLVRSKLMHEAYNKAGAPIFTEAGRLTVDLGYTKKAELEALEQAKKDYVERCRQKQEKKRRNSSASNASGAEPQKPVFFDNSIQSKKAMSVTSREGSNHDNDELVQLQNLNAKLINDIRAMKEQSEGNGSNKTPELERLENELKEKEKKLKEKEALLDLESKLSAGELEALKDVKELNEKLRKENEELQRRKVSEETSSGRVDSQPGSTAVTAGIGDSVEQLARNVSSELKKRVVGDATAEAVFRPLQGLATAYQDAEVRLSVESLVSIFACLQMKDVDAKHCERIMSAAKGVESGQWDPSPDGLVHSSTFLQYFYTQSDLFKEDRKDMFRTSMGSVKRYADDDSMLSHKSSHLKPHQPAEEQIDWDTYPLPEGGKWQRRVDKKTGRIFYQNAESRTTQWHHPLQPPKQRRGSRGGRSRQKGSQGKYRSTDDSVQSSLS